MKRREVGRNPALLLRMLLALSLLVAFYAAIALGVVAILWWQPGWVAYVFVIALVAVAAAAVHLRGTESLVLRSTRAMFPEPGSVPALQRPLERLAQLADLPVPRLALVDTDTPNAFTIGSHPVVRSSRSRGGCRVPSILGSSRRCWRTSSHTSSTATRRS